MLPKEIGFLCTSTKCYNNLISVMDGVLHNASVIVQFIFWLLIMFSKEM